MTRSHALALSGAALFLLSAVSADAQGSRPVRQCVPDVADASIYGNCRYRFVHGTEICRCALLPQAQRRIGAHLEGGVVTTGSVAPATSLPGSLPSLNGEITSQNYMYNDGWINPAVGLPSGLIGWRNNDG